MVPPGSEPSICQPRRITKIRRGSSLRSTRLPYSESFELVAHRCSTRPSHSPPKSLWFHPVPRQPLDNCASHQKSDAAVLSVAPDCPIPDPLGPRYIAVQLVRCILLQNLHDFTCYLDYHLTIAPPIENLKRQCSPQHPIALVFIIWVCGTSPFYLVH